MFGILNVYKILCRFEFNLKFVIKYCGNKVYFCMLILVCCLVYSGEIFLFLRLLVELEGSNCNVLYFFFKVFVDEEILLWKYLLCEVIFVF